MKTRFYYTLAETMKLSEDATQFAAIDKPYFMDLVEQAGVEVGGIGFYINTVVDKTNLSTDTSYSKTVMKKYIWPMYYRETVMFIDIEHQPWEQVTKPLVTSDIFKEHLKEYGGKVWAWFNESKVRYEKLAELYTNQLSNLLNQVKSNSINKFNDTPQAGASGGFAGDNYTSTITQNEAGTDAGTVIQRLDEIRKNLHSVYGEWAKEFSSFTIEE